MNAIVENPMVTGLAATQRAIERMHADQRTAYQHARDKFLRAMSDGDQRAAMGDRMDLAGALMQYMPDDAIDVLVSLLASLAKQDYRAALIVEATAAAYATAKECA